MGKMIDNCIFNYYIFILNCMLAKTWKIQLSELSQWKVCTITQNSKKNKCIIFYKNLNAGEIYLFGLDIFS